MNRFFHPVFAASLVLAACSSGADQVASARATVTDSAGVRLVEYPATVLQIPPVELPLPEVQIGAEDGDGADVFGSIRQVVRLEDGRIVVFDRQPPEVKVFGPDGSLLTRFGREGQGPGEFDPGTVSGLYLIPGDTLAVADQLGRRIQLFSPDGALLDTRLKSETADYWAYRGVYADGSWLVTITPPGPGITVGANEIRQVAARAPADLVRAESLTTFLNSAGYLFEGPGAFFINLQIPLSPQGAVVPLGDAVVAHDGSEHELRWVLPDIGVRQLVRIDVPPRAVSDADWNAERERRLAVYSPDRRPSMERAFLEMPRVRTLPAFGPGMVSDRTGVVWVPLVPLPATPDDDEGRTITWLVLQDDGGLLGVVMLPVAEMPRYLDASHLVTTWSDELDVERVRVYRLPAELGG